MNQRIEEVIKESVDRFDSRFKPIAIGYDGAEQDQQKRMDFRAFMATEVEIACATIDREAREELKTVVIEDVPHQYQGRLLKLLLDKNSQV